LYRAGEIPNKINGIDRSGESTLDSSIQENFYDIKFKNTVELQFITDVRGVRLEIIIDF
jgi:hypothetical protein